MLRFWPEYVAIHALLQTGRLGRPLSAAAYRLSNTPQWADWFRDPKVTGGVVLDLAIHDLDMMNWLFGMPQTIYASGAEADNGDWKDVYILGNHSGVKTSVQASFSMPKDLPFAAGIRVLCENGMLEYKFQAGGASLEQGLPTNLFLLHEPGKPNQPLSVPAADPYEAEIAYFIYCLQNGAPPALASAETGRDAVKAALTARQSLQTGAPMRLE